MDEVQKKLKEMEEARAKLQAKVSESLDELNRIEDEFENAKSRQAKRMRADSRVDDSIIEQVLGEEDSS